MPTVLVIDIPPAELPLLSGTLSIGALHKPGTDYASTYVF